MEGEGFGLGVGLRPAKPAHDDARPMRYRAAMARSWMVACAMAFTLFASLRVFAADEIPHVGGAGADLRGQGFELLDLTGADFRGADLREASFRGASLVGATLQGADLRGAALQGANLRNADLRGADLRGARLARADLSGADLTLADLRDVDFFQESLTTTHDVVPEGIEVAPRRSERLASEEAATRAFSVKGAVLDRALQSRPICVYPPTSAVDVLHDFDRAKGLPLVANGNGEAPGSFIEARTDLLATIGCSNAKGEATFGLTRRALDTKDSSNVAGFDAAALRRTLAGHDCAGGWLLPDEMRRALASSLDPN